MDESAEDGPGTVSSALNVALCLEDVAGGMVPDWSKSIGCSRTVDISRHLCTFSGMGTKVEAALFLVSGRKADGLGSLHSGTSRGSGSFPSLISFSSSKGFKVFLLYEIFVRALRCLSLSAVPESGTLNVLSS